MRIMLDTNVIISAIIFRSDSLTRLIDSVVQEHTLVFSTYMLKELKSVVKEKVSK